MDWPTDMHCLFLQSVLTGKAKDVHRALSTSECFDYGLVKESILQDYEFIATTEETLLLHLVCYQHWSRVFT